MSTEIMGGLIISSRGIIIEEITPVERGIIK
jgi:hypothetical protein